MRPGPSSCQTRLGIHESAASAGTAPPPMGRRLGTSYRDLPKRSVAVVLRVGYVRRLAGWLRGCGHVGVALAHQTNPDSGVIAEVIVGGARNRRAERGRSRGDAGHRTRSRCWRRVVGRRCVPAWGSVTKPTRGRVENAAAGTFGPAADLNGGSMTS